MIGTLHQPQQHLAVALAREPYPILSGHGGVIGADAVHHDGQRVVTAYERVGVPVVAGVGATVGRGTAVSDDARGVREPTPCAARGGEQGAGDGVLLRDQLPATVDSRKARGIVTTNDRANEQL